MRRLSLTFVLLASVTGSAWADRLVTIPLGKIVSRSSAKLDHLWDDGNSRRSRSVLSYGVSETLELAVEFERRPESGDKISLDLAYNISEPLTDYGPGVSIGVRDALDETSDGVYAYLATTHRVTQLGERNEGSPAEATVGIRYGRKRGTQMFLGGVAPFTSTVAFLAELDGTRFTAGLELRPFEGATVRWLHRPGQRLWSASYHLRF